MILSLVALEYISRLEVVLCETASDAAYTSIGTAILMVSRTRTVWPQLKFKVRHGVTCERGLSHHNRRSPRSPMIRLSKSIIQLQAQTGSFTSYY